VPTRIHFTGGDLAIEVTESSDELQSLLAATGPPDGPSSLTHERESRTYVRPATTGFWHEKPSAGSAGF
jgi:hypothetical protein